MNDGGPAFPNTPANGDPFGFHPGMSLRDWFAGQALKGRLAAERHSTSEDGFAGYTELAAEVYSIADAMLFAREPMDVTCLRCTKRFSTISKNQSVCGSCSDDLRSESQADDN